MTESPRWLIMSPCPSLIAFGRLWSHLNGLFLGAFFLQLHLRLASPYPTVMWKKSFPVFLFSLLTLKTALDCEARTETSICFPELPHPSLDSKMKAFMKGQNVSLICSSQNKLPQINFSLFRHGKHLRTQTGNGEPVIFNLSISEVHDLGPYKCKITVSNCSKYSHEFNFTFVEPVTTPVLNVNVIQTKRDRHITLHCISLNGSLPINYTFFEKDIAVSPVISKDVREPAEFTLTKNSTGEEEEYKCKAKNRMLDHVKYSQPFLVPSTGGDGCLFCLHMLLVGSLLVLIVIILILACWLLPKYKARKAMRNKVHRDHGNMPTEVGIYANVCKNQANKESGPRWEPGRCVSTDQTETRQPEEIQYAAPIFLKAVTPGDREACEDGKTEYVYSELNL